MDDLHSLPNAAIELHDSVVDAVRQEGTGVVVELAPAVLFRSAGVPGRDDSLVMFQDAELAFGAGRIEGATGDLPSSILHGTLYLAGERFDNMIAVPCQAVDMETTFEMLLEPDARTVKVWASSVRLTLKGDPAEISPWKGR